MAKSRTAVLEQPVLCPRHEGSLEPRDLVVGLRVIWHEINCDGKERHYWRVVVEAPHWRDDEPMVLLAHTQNYHGQPIGDADWANGDLWHMSLALLGMVPNHDGTWNHSNWLTRAES